jgi:hypothetical protein
MDTRRREIFMNIPAVRDQTEQSFEVHGNAIFGQ